MRDPRQSEPAEREQIAGDREEERRDRAIAALAGAQHGVVARGQLLDAGLTSSTIHRWTERGRLLTLHRGVYAVGHRRLRREGHWLAAVLAAGPGGLLSHREAAALHGLRPADRPRVDVTVAARRRLPGVQVHRVERIDPADATVVDGIPVTTLARTLVDLAGVVSRRALAKTLDEAERANRLDVGAVESVLERTRGRNGPGHARVRGALAELAGIGATFTRSRLEDLFLALLDAHGIARPLTNQWVHGMEVDAAWPAARLAVELDGWAVHATRRAFQDDRARTNRLTLAGWTVLRFTHDDVVRRPAGVAEAIGAALAQATAPSGWAGAAANASR